MEKLDSWNPMEDAYMDANFNSYRNGPGANLEVVPKASRSDSVPKVYKLYVGNLPTEFTEDRSCLTQIGVENLFRTYGQPINVYLHKVEHGKPVTWAFVSFCSYSEAESAIRDLDGKPPFNLKVQFALDSKGAVNRSEEVPVSLPVQEVNSSQGGQVRGRGRGTIHPSNDPRIGVDPYPREDAVLNGDKPTIFDYHNKTLLQRPRGGSGLYGPVNISMGRGGFDRAREAASHHLEDSVEVETKDLLLNLENKIILNNPVHFSKKETFNVKQQPCSVCQQTAMSVCEFCGTYYCSQQCQFVDWPKHKIVCKEHLNSRKGEKLVVKEEPDVQTRDILAGGDNAQNLQPGNENSGSGSVKKTFHQKYENNSVNFKGNDNKYKTKEENGLKQWEQTSPNGQEKKVHGAYAASGKSFKKYEHEDKNDRKGSWKNTKENIHERSQETESRFSSKEVKPLRKNEQTKNVHKDRFSRKSGPESDFKSGKDLKSLESQKGKSTDRKGPNFQEQGAKTCEGEEEMYAYEELSRSHFTQVVIVLPVGEYMYWVQLAEKQSPVLEWSIALKETEHSEVVPDIGVYCAAKFENEWYRAKITAVNPMKVHFIDYGNDESCEADDLKPLPDALKAHKAQAIKIKLAPGTPSQFKNMKIDEILKVKLVNKEDGYNVVEVAGVEYSDSSDVDVKCSGEKQGMTNAVYFCSVATNVEPNTTGMVMLFEMDTPTTGIGSVVFGGGMNVYQKLFDVLPGEFDTFPEENSPKEGEIVAYRSKEACGRGFVLKAGKKICIAGCDTGEIFTDAEIRRLPEKWRSGWHMVQCTSTQELTNTPGEQLTFEFNVNSVNETTHESQITLMVGKENVKAMLKPWDPPYDLCQETRACELKEGLCFMTSYESARVCYVRPLIPENVNSFNSLLQRVAAACHKAPKLLRSPKVGEILAALYSIDGNFFRAKVLSVKKEMAKVFFLDFGNEEEVKFDALKPLPEDLKKKEATVVRIELENVRDRPLTKAARDFLDSFVADSSQKLSLTFSVVKTSDTVVLSMPNAEDTVNIKLNKLLTPKWKDGPKDWAEVSYLEYPYEKLEVGSTCDLLVTDFVIMTTIMCVSKESKILQSLKDFLDNDITEYCNLDNRSYVPNTNELCLAKVDGIWHRASLLQNSPEKGLRMILLDAGKVLDVKHTEVRRIPEEFCILPAAAMFCVVKLKGDEEKYLEKIKQLSGCIIRAKVLEHDNDGYEIDIIKSPF